MKKIDNYKTFIKENINETELSELHNNNLAIAEYMGGKRKTQSPLFGRSYIEVDTTDMDCYVSLPKYINPHALKYTKSWDWLMPVCLKLYNENSIDSHSNKYSIQEVYDSVVEAITNLK
jgi:hypothetical protein